MNTLFDSFHDELEKIAIAQEMQIIGKGLQTFKSPKIKSFGASVAKKGEGVESRVKNVLLKDRGGPTLIPKKHQSTAADFISKFVADPFANAAAAAAPLTTGVYVPGAGAAYAGAREIVKKRLDNRLFKQRASARLAKLTQASRGK